jgi:RNA polymerase sigma-70 factor (ECF subfamily)
LEEDPATGCLKDRVKGYSESPVSEPAIADEELVKLVLAGQGDLFALLYERYYWRAFRTAYGMTGNHGAAEDLTQEIFMRMYERLKDFRSEAAFSTWFYRLAVNQSLNYRRKHRNVTQAEASDDQFSVAGDPSTSGADLLREQIHEQVHRALLTLKPKFRIIVILKDIEGLSYEEIARRTNCSPGTIASRLNRSRKLLARKLEHLKGAY